MTRRIEEYVGRKIIDEEECLKDSPISGTYRVELSDEEIIRCRDCKHIIPNQECHFFNNAFIDPNGFCAWAERSE